MSNILGYLYLEDIGDAEPGFEGDIFIITHHDESIVLGYRKNEGVSFILDVAFSLTPLDEWYRNIEWKDITSLSSLHPVFREKAGLIVDEGNGVYRHILCPLETPQRLLGRGVSRTTAWRALQRGWWVENYHTPIFPRHDDYSPGLFEHLKDPYAFAVSQVSRVCRQYAVQPEIFIKHREDWVQDALIAVWERRHCTADDPVAYAASIICGKTKDKIKAIKEWLAVFNVTDNYHEGDTLDETHSALS